MVRIDDEYCLMADERCFILKKKKETEKGLTEDVVGYYPTVAGAMTAYRRQKHLTMVKEGRMSMQTLAEKIALFDESWKKTLTDAGLAFEARQKGKGEGNGR